MSCATPASPGSARAAWPSKRFRRRPVTGWIASTRIYLHLGDGWLADQYKRGHGGDRSPGHDRNRPMTAVAAISLPELYAAVAGSRPRNFLG